MEETDSAGTLKRQYVWGEGIDECLKASIPDKASDLDNDSVTNEKVDLYYHHNSLGSVVAVTNAVGGVVESYRYSAFGKPTIYDEGGSEIASTYVEQPFMFTGARYDFEEGSGLYQMRHRYYDPVVGRFVSRDPLGLWGDPSQNGNGQGYCGHNPVNFIDPLGLDDYGPPAPSAPHPPALTPEAEADDLAATIESLVEAADALPEPASSQLRNAAIWLTFPLAVRAREAGVSDEEFDQWFSEYFPDYWDIPYSEITADPDERPTSVEEAHDHCWTLMSLGAAKTVARKGGRAGKTEVRPKPTRRPPSSRPRGGTYRLKDPNSGETRRTGKTNDLDRRESEHGRGKDTKDLDFEVDRRSNDPEARTGREQIIHDRTPGARHPSHPEGGVAGGLNKRRPISPTNPNRSRLLSKGKKL